MEKRKTHKKVMFTRDNKWFGFSRERLKIHTYYNLTHYLIGNINEVTVDLLHFLQNFGDNANNATLLLH